jgi:uncharacterized NAD-dependent epimerase/dehydratase family protein
MANIPKPYLLLIGDTIEPLQAKTAFGLRDWARADCIGQLRFTGEAVDVGLPDLQPLDAARLGAQTMVIGIAPKGGELPQAWIPVILRAIQAGLDIAAGLHQRLSDVPELVACARKHGRRLHDVRHVDTHFSVGTGDRRTGKRCLTVGTDCALGKKYTALALAKEMERRGHKVDFRATGQTGILISGAGISVDAVVADFVSGAAESLSPANEPDHWDIIEGQGSLMHPGYAAVTLGLLHGSQPDALVMCHDPLRKRLFGYATFPCSGILDAMALYLQAGRLTNQRIRFVGVSLNTGGMSAEDASALIRKTAEMTNLPCVDSMRTGVKPIVEILETINSN